MKLIALIMCALCFGMATMCALDGYSFAAGFNVFAAILNLGNFIRYSLGQ